MLFLDLKGKEKNIYLKDYQISWKGKSASKFQSRAKEFLCKHFGNLEWFEEVPLNGELSALRVDFLCRFRDKWGRQKCIIIESDGDFHNTHIPFFCQTEDDFIAMIERDTAKEIWCRKNKIPLLRLHPENEPFNLKWFNETFGFPFNGAS